MGIITFYIDPIYLIVGIVGIILMVLTLKYEYAGLIIYLIIFLLRPGETYPALAKVRPEFLLGAYLSVLALIKNKYKYASLMPKKQFACIGLLFERNSFLIH